MFGAKLLEAEGTKKVWVFDSNDRKLIFESMVKNRLAQVFEVLSASRYDISIKTVSQWQLC
jgi:hypothetical protein